MDILVMRKPYSVGYFSSYDRGLECLLDMWPRVKEQVPEATLDIYYGWDQFDNFHRKNPEKMKWRWQMTKKMHQDGITEHGRANHQQLADAMKETQVWAYPTEFTEIHCMTALKIAEAKCFPVTTGVGALKETLRYGLSSEHEDIYTNEYAQEKFILYLIGALKDYKGFMKNVTEKNMVQGRYWPDVAKKWDKALI